MKDMVSSYKSLEGVPDLPIWVVSIALGQIQPCLTRKLDGMGFDSGF